MTTADIRVTIHAALSHERETGAFRASLAAELDALRTKLLVPEDNPVDALMLFVCHYVQSVPGSINLVKAVSQQQGFYDYAAPFLHMAEDYFLQPPEVVPSEIGLAAVLDEAFLAHRLLEEVNDHHIRHLQRALLPLDMTEANLVVYCLLGESLATRLEQLVQLAAAYHLEREYVWDKISTGPQWASAQAALIASYALTPADQTIRLRLAR